MSNSETLNTCLEKYRGRGDKSEQNRRMALFCGVSYRTASEWGTKRHPTGEVLNKLWYFLQSQGLQIDELSKLIPVVFYLGRLHAFGILGCKDIKQILGIAGHDQQVWRALQGLGIPSKIRKNDLTNEMLHGEFNELLQLAVEEMQDKNLIPRATNELVPGNAVQAPQPMTRPKTDKQIELPESVRVVVAIAASSLRSLSPLLLVIRDAGPDAMEQFRAAIGGREEFHDVLDLLKGFSSRRAQEFYKGK